MIRKPYDNCVEPLESRIAPAGVFPRVIDAKWRTATVGTPLELTAGEGLSTLGNKAGSYLLFIEKGDALIFTTDFNKNNLLDPNEITGIAAGEGLRIIMFADIHGDVVTNLTETPGASGRSVLTLSDSDRNALNDDIRLGGDGKVVLNKRIEKIEFRPLALSDIPDQDNVGLDENGDGIIDPDDVDLALRTVPQSSFSIYGNIFAGGGFGSSDGGLIFSVPNNPNFLPSVDGIYTGTAVSGKYFSFGTAGEHLIGGIKVGDNINGILSPFVPSRGQAGGDINGVGSTSAIPAIEVVPGTLQNPEVQALDLTNANQGTSQGFKLTFGGKTTALLPFGATPAQVQAALGAIGLSNDIVVSGQNNQFTFTFTAVGDQRDLISARIPGGALFNMGVLHASNGGVGAKGGSILNVTMSGDDATGYSVIAGDGGNGPSGGDGGSIVNFNDLSSNTAQIYISTGSGGSGATGAGGNAGDTNIDVLNVKGEISLDLGDGGNGFLAGGRGASLAKGRFDEPEDVLVEGTNGYGTVHLPGTEAGFQAPVGSDRYNANFPGGVSSIGTHNTLDFDNDGIGDFVFITRTASTLTVLLGEPLTLPDGTPNPLFPGFREVTAPDGTTATGINLKGPRNAKALATGDLNADGHPDIAVASSDPGNPGDIMVFLSKYEDLNNDGVVSLDEDVIRQDLNGNGVYDAGDVRDDFLGFWEPRHSTLPRVVVPLLELSVNIPYTWEVEDLAIGDFDGDGLGEIVAAVDRNPLSLRAGTGPASMIVFMTPDLELNPISQQFEPTGQFYADFGTPEVLSSVNGVLVKVPAVDLIPYDFTTLPNPIQDKGVIEATSLGTGSLVDTLLWGWEGVRVITAYQWAGPRDALNPAIFPIGAFDLGFVDLDRGPGISLADFSMHDFSVTDLNLDGIADVAAISTDTQAYFMNTSIGDGFGNGLPGQGDFLTDDINNAGVYTPAQGYGVLHTIRTGDADGFFGPNDIILLAAHNSAGNSVSGGFWGPGPDGIGLGVITSVDIAPQGYVFGDQSDGGFVDTRPMFVGDVLPTLVANGENDEVWAHFNLLGLFVQAPTPLIQYSLTIRAGDGGDSLQGRGGAGGFLGGSSSVTTLIDPTTGDPVVDPVTGVPVRDLVGSLNFTTSIPIDLIGGAGGDGFSTGGVGGFISGVDIDNRPNTITNHILIAGPGGRGVSGTGGAGGSLVSNSIDYGILFQAGNGGVGRVGGAGGSVIGSGTGIFDSDTAFIDVYAGDGGLGVRGGGSGGSISNFHSVLHEKGPDVGTYLVYVAGHGGATTAGRGGSGGGVVNSSPFVGSQFASDIYVASGNGGNGAIGGNGGDITNFVNLVDGADIQYVPRYVSFISGNGGRGTSGAGGNGGNISGIDVDTFYDTGNDIPGFFFFPWGPKSPVTGRFAVERIIAGDGGASSGGKGGNGGTVSNLILSSIQGSWIVAGGAGGAGLHTGGAGGSASNILVEIGSSTFAKALIVGGEGGNARSFIPNSDDPAPNQPRNSFGGRVGKGGDGGNIVDVRQTTGVAAHIDLIAGNGGDTIHYGNPLDKPKGTFVGRGGSILNISLAGEAGNMDSSVGIRSYNNVLANESMAEFIESQFLDPNLLLPLSELNDSIGNVGVIVGSAGRNKQIVIDTTGHPFEFRSLASKNGVNGSLENFSANALMSYLAGSVDRVASIQVVKNLRVDQQIGVDKQGTVDFEEFDPFSNSFLPTVSGEPVLDGRNIDGAGVAKRFVDSSGRQISPPVNSYIR